MVDLIKSTDSLNEGRKKLNAIAKEMNEKDVISAPELIAARNGKSNLKTRLDDEHAEVTAQLQQKVDEVGGNIKSPNYSLTYGSELIPSSPYLMTGWTGTQDIGYTHIAGNESQLVFDIPSLDENKTYYVSFNTNDTVDTNGVSNFYVTMGGTEQFETYKGLATFYEFAFKPGGRHTYLRVIPRKEWTGTITNLSIKEMVGSIPPTFTVQSQSNGVASEIRAGNHTQQNTFFGTNAGQYNTGEYNTFFGYGAGQETTNGFWNTFVGWNAGRDNTIGTRNVAIGKRALLFNTTGDRNIAIGSFSLRDNKSGRSNIAIGADSLWYNETGNYNIGIGLVALGGNTSGRNNIALGERVMSGSEGGYDNVALGKLALYYNTGSDNFAVGTQAMYRNKTGSSNTALGFYSLFFNDTGGDNFAAGYRSLQNNLSGNHNIGVGKESLGSNTSGTNNLALGFNSLLNNTIGFNNISLGQNASRSIIEGDSNIAIGFNAAGGPSAVPGTLVRNVLIGHYAGLNMTTGSNYNVVIGASSGSTIKSGEKNILIGYNVQAPTSDTSNHLNIGGVIKGDLTTKVVEIANLKLTNLPTTNPAVAGQLWNDAGVLKIS